MTPSSIVLLSLGLLISKFDCKLKDNTSGIQSFAAAATC